MKKIALVLFSLLILASVALAADMQSVKSSLIDKAGYDPETKVLSIQMNNSSDVYTYEAVPQAVYDGFLEAESKGAYYVKHIKGQYKTDKAE